VQTLTESAYVTMCDKHTQHVSQLVHCEPKNQDTRLAMPLRCDGIFKNNFIANLLMNLSVQEFRKLVSIWLSYKQKSSVVVFVVHSVAVLI